MKKWIGLGVLIFLMIHAVPRQGMSFYWRKLNPAESGCLACAAIIVLPFVYLRQAIFPRDITVDINGTEVLIDRESIKRFPNGKIEYVEPVKECTLRVGPQMITFSHERGFFFYSDGNLRSGGLPDYADLLVGERKITFGCLHNDCRDKEWSIRRVCRMIDFHRNGAVYRGTLAGKTVFTVEGRTYTLKQMDSVEFDPSGRPIKGWFGWTRDNRVRVYFQTRDYRRYPYD